jgi:hypothetical protein
VRAIVGGYAEGRIKLPRVKDGKGGPIRHAPSFLPVPTGSIVSAQAETIYSAATLVEFLGWPSYKVEATLEALALIESDLATDEQFKDLSTKQAEVVATETRRVLKETGKKGLAKTIGRKLAAGMNKSTKGRDAAGQERNIQDVTIHNARWSR